MKRIWEWLLKAMSICTLIIFFAAFLTDTSYKESVRLEELEIVSAHQEENGNWHYVVDTSLVKKNEDSMGFYTNHQKVRVFANGELLYARMEEGDLWGDTLGCMWNFVPIPADADAMDVYVEAVYDDIQGHTLEFFHGDEASMVKTLIRNSLPLAITSGLLILAGIVMIVFWFALRNKAAIGTAMFYLGCVSLLLGGWCYNETNFAILTIPQRMASAFLAYMFLMVLPPAFLLFIREFLKMGSKFMGKVLTAVTVAEYVLVLGMHFLNIRDARENLYIIHTALAIGVLYVLVCLGIRIARREVDRRTKLSIIGFSILTVSALGDILSYYINLGNMFYFSALGFLVFIFLMGWETTVSTFNLIKKGAYAEEYEKMATVDALTGLYNRNSYEKDIMKYKHRNHIMVVTFDINDLKRCNDKLGHRVGDKHIADVARRIEDLFEKYGKCYRIGGDEFCCVVEHDNRCPIEKLTEKIEAHSWAYTNGDRVFVGGVACGYAGYNPTSDISIETARERADELMYQRKGVLKKKVMI